MIYSGDTGCGGTDGTVFAGDCSELTSVQSYTNGYCGGTWTDGGSLECDSSGVPTYVSRCLDDLSAYH
jgi:hypothetical protein